MKDIDYRELLIKYMAHVKACEGITFVDYPNYGKVLNNSDSDILEGILEAVAKRYYNVDNIDDFR